MAVQGLANLFWLVLFLAIGFPVALGIELYLRGGTWWQPRAPEYQPPLFDEEFMKVPEDSAIARRMREPAIAAISEPN